MAKIDWDAVSEEDRELAKKIAKRASNEIDSGPHWQMDIEAAHLNLGAEEGRGLDLETLLKADGFNFAHDVCRIASHLNRETGEVEGCFLPRIMRRPSAAE